MLCSTRPAVFLQLTPAVDYQAPEPPFPPRQKQTCRKEPSGHEPSKMTFTCGPRLSDISALLRTKPWCLGVICLLETYQTSVRTAGVGLGILPHQGPSSAQKNQPFSTQELYLLILNKIFKIFTLRAAWIWGSVWNLFLCVFDIAELSFMFLHNWWITRGCVILQWITHKVMFWKPKSSANVSGMLLNQWGMILWNWVSFRNFYNTFKFISLYVWI